MLRYRQSWGSYTSQTGSHIVSTKSRFLKNTKNGCTPDNNITSSQEQGPGFLYSAEADEVRKLLRLSLRPAEVGSPDLRKAAVSLVTAGTSQHGESA